MAEKEPRFLIARLRPLKDRDLIDAIRGVPRGLLADYIRAGLRLLLCHSKKEEPRLSEPLPKLSQRQEPGTPADLDKNLERSLKGL